VKRLISRLYDDLIRVAGGRPEVVRPLFLALLKSDEGQNEILREKNPRKTFVSGKVLRILTLVIAVLGSIALAVIMAVNPGQQHPPVSVLILVAVHYLIVLSMVIADAGPGLLAQDDYQIIGWWPLTRREQLLARISVILKPALEVSVALCTAPLLVYLYRGTPPVLGALIFGLGLLVQAIGVTFGVTTVLLLSLRWFGRRKAERLVGMVSSGPSNILILLFMSSYIIDDFIPWAATHSWIYFLMPPVWFGAWGDLTAGFKLWVLAGLGLVMAFLMIWAGMRLSVSGNSGIGIKTTQQRPSRFNLSALISFLLRPLMPGVEGWAIRKLLEAHLREDWRFVGSMMTVPALLVLFAFGLGDGRAELSPDEIKHTALIASNMLSLMIFTGAMVLNSVQFSSTPEAFWVVALADLDTNRILASQRGMIRGLIFVPGGIIYVFRALALGATWPVIFMDLAILGLEMDLLLLILQPWLARMPFSSQYSSDHSSRRILMGFILMAISGVFLAADFTYARVDSFRYVLWVVLPLLWLFFRWRLQRVMKDRRLAMDVVTV